MTDHLDNLLRDAGERWRAAQAAPPEPDQLRWSEPVRGPWSRGWVAALGAAAAAAVVVGVASVLAGSSQDGQHTAADDVSTASAPDVADLIVRDGDEVEAVGLVVAAPGRPVRFCAPATTTGAALPGDTGVPSCDYGVVVTGVDLDALAGAEKRAGVRFGTADLRGTWDSGQLSVSRQTAPGPAAPQPVPEPPCPPPAGGWKSIGPADGKALHRYVEEEHPDQFRRPWVAGSNGAEVLVVELVRGDIGKARAELRSRYAGNLCVVAGPGRASLADQSRLATKVQPALGGLLQDQASGVYALGGTDGVLVEMVMLTPGLHERLNRIGLESLDLRPWLRPVR